MAFPLSLMSSTRCCLPLSHALLCSDLYFLHPPLQSPAIFSPLSPFLSDTHCLCRYMYHPMGGHSRRLLIVWPIFIFIGLWHDLEWTWLAWALFNCAFMTFEATDLLLCFSSSSSFDFQISVSKAFKGSSLQRRCEDGYARLSR